MQIKCPNCGFAGNIADKLVPDEGRNVSCPKCKTAIFVKKGAPPPPAPEPEPEPAPQTIPVREVRSYLGSQSQPDPPRETSVANKPQRQPVIAVDKMIFTKLAAIVSGGICIATGIYLADTQPANGEGNVMFTICNGIGYYFIAKGIYVGFSLWNMTKLREGQEKRA